MGIAVPGCETGGVIVGSRTTVLAAADFTDPGNARVILMAAGGLVALAVLLSLGTVWWWRTSKVEHPALGPLEVMSSRRWALSSAEAIVAHA